MVYFLLFSGHEFADRILNLASSNCRPSLLGIVEQVEVVLPCLWHILALEWEAIWTDHLLWVASSALLDLVLLLGLLALGQSVFVVETKPEREQEQGHNHGTKDDDVLGGATRSLSALGLDFELELCLDLLLWLIVVEAEVLRNIAEVETTSLFFTLWSVWCDNLYALRNGIKDWGSHE